MNTTETYQSAIGQIHRIVEQGGRRLSLVTFTSFPQLHDILRELGTAHPDRPLIEVTYDPLRISAPQLFASLEGRVNDLPVESLPLIILSPAELSAAPESEAAAYDFWQAMNFRREFLGKFPAQLLLCVDLWNQERLVDRAPDLWSWLVPKVDLTLPPESLAQRGELLPALAFFSNPGLSPESASAQWDRLWPVLQRKAAQREVEPGDFRRLIFPLLHTTLASGNLVHAREVRDAALSTRVPTEDQLGWHMMNAMLACGAEEFPQAEEHARQLLAILERASGEPAFTQARAALFQVGPMLSRLSQSAVAENLFRRLTAWCQFQLGPEHKDTLISQLNFSNALKAQRNFTEAERQCRAVLAIEKRIHGPTHPNTALVRNNLGALLGEQGRYDEAEQEFRTAFAVRKARLGDEHPDTLMSRMNLALVLGNRGKHSEAEEEQADVLKAKLRTLGAEHPATLESQMGLADAFFAQGKLAEAEQQQRSVLDVRGRVLGTEHFQTLMSVYNLALSLKMQKKEKEALALFQRSLASFKRTLGDEHPFTKRAKAQIADLSPHPMRA